MNNKIILTGIIFITLSSSAHAYLDPGSGSMLLSIVVGIVISVWFYSKSIFYKIGGIFRKKSLDNSINSEENENLKDDWF